jgi:hypothetical protein
MMDKDSKPLVYVFRDIVQSVSDDILPGMKDQLCCEIKCSDINYQFGSWIEFCNKMNEWSMAPEYREQKFPCVFLVEDFQIINSAADDFNSCTVDIFILAATKQEYDSFQRQEYVFNMVLEPIYQALMDAIFTCGDFNILDVNRDIPHVKINRKFLGKQAISIGKEGLKLNDYVDAIQLQNLKLKLYKNVT